MAAKSNLIKQPMFSLFLIILLGIIVRLYFQVGHVFSDDAYYSYLSYSLLYSNFGEDYLGYPVFPLRFTFIALNSLSMMIFGINEFSTILFPFIVSILNIFLVYKLTLLITKDKSTAISGSFLIAFFPTDIVFASLNFPDLINVFFINLGIYFLLKSYSQYKSALSYLGGFFLFFSMQIKENVYFVLILLSILFIYFLIKKKKLISQIFIGITFILLNYFIEGLVYLFLNDNFFYRITITNLNYQYSFYDFFPYTAQKISESKNYLRNLFDQLIQINAKSVFVRRFYLFLPIVASVQTYLNIRKNKFALINFWFWGTALLMITFTTSFTEYKPLDLSRSWYIYPLLMPAIILSSIFLNKFSRNIKAGLIIIYTLGSLIMCFEYQTFFNADNFDELKGFLRKNSSQMIYTDHFTKYSVDLIRNYESNNSERLLGNDFNFSQIRQKEWLLYNYKHIKELELQKYEFPDFSILKSNQFKQIASFNDFIFYEKLP